jgi:hypothetical protein
MENIMNKYDFKVVTKQGDVFYLNNFWDSENGDEGVEIYNSDEVLVDELIGISIYDDTWELEEEGKEMQDSDLKEVISYIENNLY